MAYSSISRNVLKVLAMWNGRIGVVGGLFGVFLMACQAANATESQVVTGVVVSGGIVCPLLRMEQGEPFPLQGVQADLYPVGTLLELQGRFVDRSICQQGPKAFVVDQVRKATSQN